MRQAIPAGSNDLTMVFAVRVASPSNPKDFPMLMSFAFAIATMIAVLGCQTVLKLGSEPVTLGGRRTCPR